MRPNSKINLFTSRSNICTEPKSKVYLKRLPRIATVVLVFFRSLISRFYADWYSSLNIISLVLIFAFNAYNFVLAKGIRKKIFLNMVAKPIDPYYGYYFGYLSFGWSIFSNIFDTMRSQGETMLIKDCFGSKCKKPTLVACCEFSQK